MINLLGGKNVFIREKVNVERRSKIQEEIVNKDTNKHFGNYI